MREPVHTPTPRPAEVGWARRMRVGARGPAAPWITLDATRRKQARYLAVTVFSVACTQALLLVLQLVGLPAAAANVGACLGAAAPVFALNRRWVWHLAGPASLRREVVPFWSLTALGLVASTVAVAAVSTVTTAPVVVAAANIGAFGLLWVAKYAALDAAAAHLHGAGATAEFAAP